jgi:hypothetical protein
MRETRIGRASVLKWMDLGGLLYVQFGRPSVPPELLLRALLESLYSIRSDRQLMEQLDYNLLFRWFVWLGHRRPRMSGEGYCQYECNNATGVRAIWRPQGDSTTALSLLRWWR